MQIYLLQRVHVTGKTAGNLFVADMKRQSDGISNLKNVIKIHGIQTKGSGVAIFRWIQL
jgi:hypothetical protein